MQITKQTLPKSQVALTIELSAEEMQPFVQRAAQQISQTKKIPGFRPGHIPFERLVQEVGEMEIYQQAGHLAVESTYYQALEQEKIAPAESPHIEIVKIAPNNPFIFKATLALMPLVTICAYDKIKVAEPAKIVITDADVDSLIKKLQDLRAKEVLVTRPAAAGDGVELDFDTFRDNVPIENGQSRKHKLIIGQNQMIPGFEDNLIGLIKDQEKEFDLNFPNKYHIKALAGQKAHFKVKILAVYQRELAPVDDAFAKTLGMKDLANLRATIKDNLKAEKEQKAKEKLDLEIIEQILEKSEFTEIPESLINQETHKMLEELQDNLGRQGLKIEDYLQHLKKTEAELRLDFTVDAIKRVKSAVAIRQIAVNEKIQPEAKAVENEIQRTLLSYKMNPQGENLADLEKRLNSHEARHYFESILRNRQTMEHLRALVLKK